MIGCKLSTWATAAALCASTAGLFANTGFAMSRDEERIFQPGELVKTGGGQVWKILQCRPEKVSRDMECEFVSWKNGGATSNKLWMMASQIAAAEARVKQAEEQEAMTDNPAEPSATDANEMPPETDPAGAL